MRPSSTSVRRQQALVEVLVCDPSAEVSVEGGLVYVRRLLDGGFAVGSARAEDWSAAERAELDLPDVRGGDGWWEAVFTSPRLAVRAFEQARRVLRAGAPSAWSAAGAPASRAG